jgi:hypothetical protein
VPGRCRDCWTGPDDSAGHRTRILSANRASARWVTAVCGAATVTFVATRAVGRALVTGRHTRTGKARAERAFAHTDEFLRSPTTIAVAACAREFATAGRGARAGPGADAVVQAGLVRGARPAGTDSPTLIIGATRFAITDRVARGLADPPIRLTRRATDAAVKVDRTPALTIAARSARE